MQSKNFDRTDMEILAALQGNGRLSSAELAERVSLTPSPCWRRVKRLEDEGVIRGYRTEIDVRKLGFNVTAFVLISLDQKAAERVKAFEDAVKRVPEVLSCHCVSGRYDHQLTVIARDLDAFGELTRYVLGALPGVKEVYTSFVLKEVKGSGHAISLPAE
ncbi:Lrp/AsnC family transcriptional regulator [Paraburkholderia domus]|uniref:Lrp/AsnC family transcriptional regulator n=1 Tax=Paraburkholderia domus TaxID=2793075 RepID=UPI001B0AE9D7|nr:Lrp/AsnC family transcriptional regulator [Paraburkholderia domus]CAE6820986.1 Leucine-responsive regulatory protein [Paraburkholderia domus]